MLILIPSLALLFGLLLGGRFDPGAVAPAADGPPSAVGRARTPAAARPAVLACAALGLALMLAFDGGVGLALGVLALLAALAGGFLLLAPAILAATDGDD
jgi:hypothetical protein